ncbi:hypothetical protein GGX14DRAFT_388490 [Mycena pura]|uniref:Uncharacterized protein n=1 Tax=Mycena pura TaxID=153505 RepID=A0AAD6VT85_9AGAR|nr:hypothetical protein GGX14DRAFT_388490 [Mycena pura]
MPVMSRTHSGSRTCPANSSGLILYEEPCGLFIPNTADCRTPLASLITGVLLIDTPPVNERTTINCTGFPVMTVGFYNVLGWTILSNDLSRSQNSTDRLSER